MHQKQKPTRAPTYLSWVRQQPCEICGAGPSEAAHQRLLSGGMGSKPNDHHAIPLCYQCHMEGEHTRGVLTTWNERSGQYFKDKHDLRDYLRKVCERLFERYETEKNAA